MAGVNQKVVELVAARLAESDELLDRFLDAPVAVTSELTNEPLDQATLEAIGDRLRERFSVADGSELSDADLQEVAGGFGRYAFKLRAWKPVIGPSSDFTRAISIPG